MFVRLSVCRCEPSQFDHSLIATVIAAVASRNVRTSLLLTTGRLSQPIYVSSARIMLTAMTRAVSGVTKYDTLLIGNSSVEVFQLLCSIMSDSLATGV
jgi:hypothetical protein